MFFWSQPTLMQLQHSLFVLEFKTDTLDGKSVWLGSFPKIYSVDIFKILQPMRKFTNKDDNI